MIKPRSGPAGDETVPAVDEFKEAMAAIVTPVVAVTSLLSGTAHGTTASEFSSLSAAPPMVITALDRQSELLTVVERAGQFDINVLSAQKAEVACVFATKGGAAKFDGVESLRDSVLAVLPTSAGCIVADLADLLDAGDHVLALGMVRPVSTRQCPPPAYWRRTFGTYTLRRPSDDTRAAH
jgi:flavin reductase (DIM6/NTAB) family NADH-FMN oxidoreductase RutF